MVCVLARACVSLWSSRFGSGWKADEKWLGVGIPPVWMCGSGCSRAQNEWNAPEEVSGECW
jgi:hypothetical protein